MSPTQSPHFPVPTRSTAVGLVLLLLSGCATEPGRAVSGHKSHLLVGVSLGNHRLGLLREERSDPVRDSQFDPMAWPGFAVTDVQAHPRGRWIWAATPEGVLVSRDSGQTFILASDPEIRDVQSVALDSRNPAAGFAATASGIAITQNILDPKPWRMVRTDQFGYCYAVAQDAMRPDRLWVGTDSGLFSIRSDGTGSPVRHPLEQAERGLAGDHSARVHCIAQDPSQPSRLMVATAGQGLLESRDGGRSWERHGDVPAQCFTVITDGRKRGRWAVGGPGYVVTSTDGGKTFHSRSTGLPRDVTVLDLAPDPSGSDRFSAGTDDGVYRSGAIGWRRVGLTGCRVASICSARLPTNTRRRGPSTEPGQWIESEPLDGAMGSTSRPGRDMGHYLLALPLIREHAATPTSSAFDLWQAIAILRDGTVDAAFWRRLDTLIGASNSEATATLAAVAFALHGGDRLAPRVWQQLGVRATHRPMRRGRTDHGALNYYTAILLAAQSWPTTSAAEWFNGHSTTANYRAARRFLFDFAVRVGRQGLTEFDSPTVLHEFITPLLLIHDFAVARELRAAAAATLDVLLADYLTESLRGTYCGAHAAVDTADTIRTGDRARGYHYIFAGGIDAPKPTPSWLVATAYTQYRPDPVLRGIANDRRNPFVHQERKPGPTPTRDRGVGSPSTRRYTYMTEYFGMGSLQGGIHFPVQQHSWDVSWRSDSANATLFAVHPSWSEAELTSYIPGSSPQRLAEAEDAQRDYRSADKWVSASPHERLLQDKNALLAVYRLPEDTPHREVDLYWPDALARTRDGEWWFGRDRDFYVAVWLSGPVQTIDAHDHTRLRSRSEAVGVVVLCGHARLQDDDQSGGVRNFDRFRGRVLGQPTPRFVTDAENTSLSYRTPDHRELNLSYFAPKFDSEERPMLFDGPFVRSFRDTGIVELRDARGSVRRIDFRRFASQR